MSSIVLHAYWRSSCSYRVRIALGAKGLDYATHPVNLLAGAHLHVDYTTVSPTGYVPTLEVDGEAFIESMAILELLEEIFPTHPLLPKDHYLRARARELAELVNAGIQPHQNMGPMARIDALAKGAGRAHAIHYNESGLRALEERVKETAGEYCVGDHPTFADCCLVPQLFSARRFEIDVAHHFPTLTRIDAALAKLPGVFAAHPDRQPDSEK